MDWTKLEPTSIWHLADTASKQWAAVAAIASGGWAAITALIEGYTRIQDFALRLKYKEKGYSVESTLYKDVIEDGATNVLKLRTLRIYGNLQQLDFDVWPTIVLPNGDEKDCSVPTLYSVPGQAIRIGEQKVAITFQKEERPKPHTSYSIALAFTIAESIADLYTPPFLIADHPVGNELLVLEIHFPPTHTLKKNPNEACVVLSAKKVDEAEWVTIPLRKKKWFGRPRQTFVESARFDFLNTGTPTDWLRVSIVKPPKNSQIRLEWDWEQKPAEAAVPADNEQAQPKD